MIALPIKECKGLSTLNKKAWKVPCFFIKIQFVELGYLQVQKSVKYLG